MTEDIDEILAAREKRGRSLAALARAEGTACVLKANMPALPKNTRASGLLIRLFDGLIQSFSPKKRTFVASVDGDHVLYSFAKDASFVKRITVFLEEHHPLGRFVDIDVHGENGPISRRDLGLPARKCWLCEQDAHICARAERHSKEALLRVADDALQEHIPALLTTEALHALRKELFTYPSLGLVSARDTGRHSDMNISHFLAALETLKPHFQTYARLGLARAPLQKLREEGRRAEKRMLAKTAGVNTHKGANYIFGLVIYHQAGALLLGKDFTSFREDVKKTARRFFEEDFGNLDEKKVKTRGETVHLSLGEGGVREEAAAGFPAVFSTFPDTSAHPLRRLVRIMARTLDTTLYNGDAEAMRTIKEEAARKAEEDFSVLSEWARRKKREGVSPGGAADLLALSFYCERTVHLFRR